MKKLSSDVTGSLVFGRPVIGSVIGGTAEKVELSISGEHFRARDSLSPHELIETVKLDTAIYKEITNNIPAPPLILGQTLLHLAQYKPALTARAIY